MILLAFFVSNSSGSKLNAQTKNNLPLKNSKLKAWIIFFGG